MPFPPPGSTVASLIGGPLDERLRMTWLLRPVEHAHREPMSGDFDWVEALRSRESDLMRKSRNMNNHHIQ